MGPYTDFGAGFGGQDITYEDDRLPNGMLRSVTPWSADEELARQQAEADMLRDEELAHEAEQDRQQIMHDEMVDDMLAQDGRWG